MSYFFTASQINFDKIFIYIQSYLNSEFFFQFYILPTVPKIRTVFRIWSSRIIILPIRHTYILRKSHMLIHFLIKNLCRMHFFIYISVRDVQHIYCISHVRMNKSVNFEQLTISIFIIHSWINSLFSHLQSQYLFCRMINH